MKKCWAKPLDLPWRSKSIVNSPKPAQMTRKAAGVRCISEKRPSFLFKMTSQIATILTVSATIDPTLKNPWIKKYGLRRGFTQLGVPSRQLSGKTASSAVKKPKVAALPTAIKSPRRLLYSALLRATATSFQHPRAMRTPHEISKVMKSQLKGSCNASRSLAIRLSTVGFSQ
jgi:hypothetical protein